MAGDLLVGNFGDGRINVFDPVHGTFVQGLKDPDGEPIQIDGLWALKVGNGGNGGSANNVYFTAGLDDERHGSFGSLAPANPGDPEGNAEAQMLQAAVAVFQLDLATLQADIAANAPRATLRADLAQLEDSLDRLVRAEVRFLSDTRADAGLGHHHDADDDGDNDGGVEHAAREALAPFFAQFNAVRRMVH